jgi:hypothetical protein
VGILEYDSARLLDQRLMIHRPWPAAVERRQRVQPPADRLHNRRQIDRFQKYAV